MSAQQCYYCDKPIAADAQACPSCGQPLVLQNKYRIQKVLGQGGFGIVYDALDTRLNRHCAIKVLTSASISQQQTVEAEAAILAKYASQFDFIPHIYDIWGERSQTYFVMEYIDGPALDQLLDKVWGAADVEKFLRTLLNHLSQIHEAGIIHRDIKPGNIKRTAKGRYVLLDFGIAKQGGATLVGAKALSMDYGPPEQLQGHTTDARADLYSLAATAYQLLTGRTPPRADVRLAAGTPVPAPSSIVPGVPPNLERTLLKMLELRPEDRPIDADAAKAMLDGAQPGRGDVVAPTVAPVNAGRGDIKTEVVSGSTRPPGGFPPQQGGFPPQGGGYQSPQGGGFPPQQGGFPPQGGGYQSPQGGGFPPQQGGYQQAGYQTPQQGGFQQAGYQQARPLAGMPGAKRPWWMYAIPVVLLLVAVGGFLAYSSGQAANRSATQTSVALAQRQTETAEARATDQAVAKRETSTASKNATATAEAEAEAAAATETAAAEQTATAEADNNGTNTGDVVDLETAQSEWPAIVEEYFLANDMEWPEGDYTDEFLTGNRVIDTQAGVYRWEATAHQSITWHSALYAAYTTDFYTSIEGELLEGPADAHYGLTFRHNTDTNDRYRFMLMGSQWIVDANIDGEWETLISYTDSGYILPGSNYLSVIGQGDYFRFFINFHQVGELTDDRLPDGSSGPAIDLRNENDLGKFVFDNFEVRGYTE